MRKGYVEQGLEATLHRKKPDREYERCLDGKAEAHLIALACGEPPAGYERWSLRLLASEMVELGYNYRITDIQCALGLAQMNRLDGFKARRQAIARHYNERFASSASDGLITLPPWPAKTDPCFHLYVLRFEEGAERRKRVFMGLKERNIHTQVHYIPVHLQPYYRQAFGYRRGDFPLAEAYYEKALSLPLYPTLTDQDVDFVAESVLNFLKD